jgi:hypothetical protein
MFEHDYKMFDTEFRTVKAKINCGCVIGGGGNTALHVWSVAICQVQDEHIILDVCPGGEKKQG